MTRTLLVSLAGIPQRVGYATSKQKRFLTHTVRPLHDMAHRSDVYTNVIASCGIEIADRACRLQVPAAEEKAMARKLQALGVTPADRLVVINAGGNWDLKRWPKENFFVLVRRLMKNFDVKVIIPGAAKDEALAREIAEWSTTGPIVWAGATTLKELAALFKRANVLISNDTGPLHLASSVGCPVIGIFGPTRPEVTGPRTAGRHIILQHDVGCNRAACYHLTCKDNVCMKSVTVDDVLEAFQKITAQ